MANKVEGLMGVSVEKIRELVDANTVVGTPISVGEGLTVIPVSKVSYGFASGGSDLPAKSAGDLFGGGAGAGISIDPIAFIVVTGDDVKVLPYAAPPAGTSDRAVSIIPEMFDKVVALFQKKKDKAEEASAEEIDAETAAALAAEAAE